MVASRVVKCPAEQAGGRQAPGETAVARQVALNPAERKAVSQSQLQDVANGDLCLTNSGVSLTLPPVSEIHTGVVSPVRRGASTMAKPATLQIKLVSTADTGYFYVTKKNPRTKPEKLEVRKYDPKARKHVLFREAKIK